MATIEERAIKNAELNKFTGKKRDAAIGSYMLGATVERNFAIGAGINVKFLADMPSEYTAQNINSLRDTARAASAPRYVDGGILIPALGIILDLNNLSVEEQNWPTAMKMAQDAGKRLPTREEWHYMCYFKDEINALIREHGGTELNSYYWSSTECSTFSAWLVHFSSGGIYYGGKCNGGVVRAVAAF